jgi:uncharacterized protein (TIGR01777 family)
MKKIIITGATGSIGQKLLKELNDRSDQVVVFTRDPLQAKSKILNANKFIRWKYDNKDDWIHELNGVDTVIHLAGVNLSSKRWDEDFKKLAYDSRVISTRNIVEAIKMVEKKPKVFICASAVGIYGDRYDEVLDETSSLGNDYLANLCKDWENEAEKVEELGVRRVSIRTASVLLQNEGALKRMLLPYKFFIGGPLGNGRQWYPWIHIDDIIGIYLHIVSNDIISGPVNATSPGIVRMSEFSKTLGKVIKRPSIFKVPKFAIKLIAGELGEYVVTSQRTSADKIINAGYKFKFENLEEALRDLM